jgi:hypothetical protein
MELKKPNTLTQDLKILGTNLATADELLRTGNVDKGLNKLRKCMEILISILALIEADLKE